MSNDSSVAGFLSPTSAYPYDSGLDQIFHDMLAGIVGITGDLVRPRWQPEPPTQPPFDTNWIAFGVSKIKPDTFAYIGHDPNGDGGLGADVVERDERLDVLVSFIGPQPSTLLNMLIDGLQVGQNRDQLWTFGITLVEFSEPTMVPALTQEKWVKRMDTTGTFRRRTARGYNINNIQSAQATIYVSSGMTYQINVNQ